MKRRGSVVDDLICEFIAEVPDSNELLEEAEFQSDVGVEVRFVDARKSA